MLVYFDFGSLVGLKAHFTPEYTFLLLPVVLIVFSVSCLVLEISAVEISAFCLI